MIKVGIITLSDKGFIGERVDITGDKLKEMILNHKDYEFVYYNLLPDTKDIIERELKELCDNKIVDLILTNGGTGFSKRDITPEATLSIIEKSAPGISEYMRMKSLEITPKAMLSRGVSGIREETLIINLPGSPKGATENFSFVIDSLKHGIEILKGSATECATPIKK